MRRSERGVENSEVRPRLLESSRRIRLTSDAKDEEEQFPREGNALAHREVCNHREDGKDGEDDAVGKSRDERGAPKPSRRAPMNRNSRSRVVLDDPEVYGISDREEYGEEERDFEDDLGEGSDDEEEDDGEDESSRRDDGEEVSGGPAHRMVSSYTSADSYIVQTYELSVMLVPPL